MFDGVKIFSATKLKERQELGEAVTEWLATQRGQIIVVDRQVLQSSDHAYHCLTIALFYRHTTKQDA